MLLLLFCYFVVSLRRCAILLFMLSINSTPPIKTNYEMAK